MTPLTVNRLSLPIIRVFPTGSSSLNSFCETASVMITELGVENRTLFSPDMKGKVIFLNIWATWCPHCRSQLKTLNSLAGDIRSSGVKLILIDVGEPKEAVDYYANDKSIAFEILLDGKSEVAELYGLIGVPTYVTIDNEGVIQGIGHSLPADFLGIAQ